MNFIPMDVIFLVYCCTVDMGVVALMLFSFLKRIGNRHLTDHNPFVYASVSFLFSALIIGLCYVAIMQDNYSSNLCFTIAMITFLTVILLFCLTFRVFEVLHMDCKKQEDKDCERRLKRRDKELSFGGVLLSFLGVAFPLFLQANSCSGTVAGKALLISALALGALLLMFSWYSEIVWDCNEEKTG